MGWLSLIWLAMIFAGFYIGLPWLARGRKGLIEGLVWTAFVMQFTTLLLGTVGLALPGIVLSILLASLVASAVWNRAWYLQPAAWRELLVELLEAPERAKRFAEWRSKFRLPSTFRSETGLWVLLFLAYGYSHAAFAVANLRFLDLSNYARALSLGVLSAGQAWQADATVPILLPLQILSALPSPAVIRFTGPIIALLFVISVALLAYEYSRNRNAALFATALCMVAPTWRGGLGGSELGAAEISATFAVLSLALVKRSRLHALLAAMLAVGISVDEPFLATALTGLGCAAAAITAPLFVLAPRIVAAIAICAVVWFHPVSRPDGPHQYEAAARVCEEITRSNHRNSWLMVATAEELPFVYGRGWHMPLGSFVVEFSPEAMAKDSFRLPYQVKDVFLFVERQPLRDDLSLRGVVQAETHSAMARASLQFAAARLIASYQRAHNDLKIVFANDQLTVYQLPGALAAAGRQHSE
jgi:hypothetical protein